MWSPSPYHAYLAQGKARALELVGLQTRRIARRTEYFKRGFKLFIMPMRASNYPWDVGDGTMFNFQQRQAQMELQALIGVQGFPEMDSADQD